MIKEICISLLLFLYVAFAGWYFILPLFGHAPYYPSSKKTIKDILRLADIKRSDKVVDLGSGDGRVVFSAAKISNDVTGVEHNPFFAGFCKFRNLFVRKKGRIRFICGDIYKQDLSEYDVILCYLLPSSMRKLEEKIANEARPGTRIVSNTFHIEGIREKKKLNKIKLYVV